MRTLIIIALLFLWNNSFSQSYVASWTGTANSFEVQRSSDKKNWKTVSTIKNINTYSGTGATYYWRVKLNTSSGTLYSNIVWVYAFTTITNARFRSGYVSWTSYGETNLDYYTINDLRVTKGKRNYSIKVTTASKYYIVAHYKNGDSAVLKSL